MTGSLVITQFRAMRSAAASSSRSMRRTAQTPILLPGVARLAEGGVSALRRLLQHCAGSPESGERLAHLRRERDLHSTLPVPDVFGRGSSHGGIAIVTRNTSEVLR